MEIFIRNFSGPWLHWHFPVLDYTDIFRSLITLRFSGPWLHWHFQVLDYTDIFRYLITLTFLGPWLHWYFQVLDYTEIFRSLITLTFSGPWLHWDFQVLDYTDIFRIFWTNSAIKVSTLNIPKLFHFFKHHGKSMRNWKENNDRRSIRFNMSQMIPKAFVHNTTYSV